MTSPAPVHEPVHPRAQASHARVVPLPDHAAAIEEQSLRLAARLRPDAAFTQPQRDPFHFGAPRHAGPGGTGHTRTAATTPAEPAAVAAVEAAPFPYRLSGTASDTVDGQVARTAVLSGGATGLVLAVVGDTVGAVYRVARIDEAAVELTDTRDGHAITLTLATP
jgi:hypothetical protein